METRTFSTRTERKTKDNPHYGDTYIIGLDMGYSGPKGFHEKGNFVFPNYCQKITGELFSNLNKNDYIYEDLDTGEKFWVGEMATKSLSEDSVVAEDSLFGRNHYLHPNFLITFRTALGLALWDKYTDGSDIFIQTGLPPAYIQKDESYLRSVIQKRHHFKLNIGTKDKGTICKEFDVTIDKSQVDVMYQPMGTFYSVVTDNEGNLTRDIANYMNSNLLVFDGGFGTLDNFLVKGKQLTSKGTDPNLGMRRVLEETRKIIHKELDTQISIPAMQTCLKTGKIKVNDMVNIKVVDYPIDEYLVKANEIVREEAFESIKD